MATVDVISIEIQRARELLDKYSGDIETYKLLEILGNILYLMWLEATGIMRTPETQGKVIPVSPEQLAKVFGKEFGKEKPGQGQGLGKESEKSDGYI